MVERVSALTGGQAVVVAGVGQHQMYAAQHFRFDRPRSWINSGGLGTMGFAVPAAMGAKVGRPDELVVAIDGDGCFQMTAQELATCTTERIPIKVFILNNGHLGMVRQWQELFYDERYSEVHLGFECPDYVKLAEAYGALGLRCDRAEDVDATLEKALATDDQSVVVDFRVDSHEGVFPMVPAGRPNDEIILGPEFSPRSRRRRPAGRCVRDEHPHHLGPGRGQAGVLARISGLFSRRGFNIDSLAVGPTEDPGRSRMTIVVDCAERPLEQVTKQLNKLVHVLKIVELEPDRAVERELVLVKVRAEAAVRYQIVELAEMFRAKIVDVAPDALTIEATGSPAKVQAMLELLDPYGIRELARTGRVALARARDRRQAAAGGPPAWRSSRQGGTTRWPPSTTTTTPTSASSSPARSPCSATAPRATPTPCRCTTRAARSGSGWPRVQEPGCRRGGRADRDQPGRGLRLGRPDHGAGPRHRAAPPVRHRHRPQPQPRRRPVLRPRLQHPLRLHPGARHRRRGHGRPKGPGHLVRRQFENGQGTPVLVAVAQDASGKAWDLAKSYARAIGGTRAGALVTTFQEETETDLFGEQAVLCGGATALVQAGFETLTKAGYQPEVAYFECLHELKLIVDLMYEGGLAGMRYSVSDTAEYGDYTRGPGSSTTDQGRDGPHPGRDPVGSFAREWVDEDDQGRPNFTRMREAGANHPIEQTGKPLRRMMSWLRDQA